MRDKLKLAHKTGHIAAITRNGLASNCGDDKDAIASICDHLAKAHGFPRSGQHNHPARRGSGDGRHPVEPAGAALRRAPAAGLSGDRHAGRRCRPRPAAVRRRPHHLSGGIGGAGADPVRRRIEDAVSKHPRRAGAVDGAGNRRRAADGAGHGAGREICARPRLDRGAAGRCGGGLHRRGGGVSSGAYARPAAAPAGRRDAGG